MALPKTLTGDQVDALMDAPNLATPTGLRDRCILALMHRCGLRVSETCHLHLRDVDWRAGTIRLRAEITKGGKEAVAIMDPPTLALLEQWKHARRPYAAGKPWLFVRVRSGTGQGDPVTRRDMYKMVRRRGEKAGAGHVTPHMLRHTFATELLASGDFSIREVQTLLRHADVRTTQIYTHVSNADLQRKVRARA